MRPAEEEQSQERMPKWRAAAGRRSHHDRKLMPHSQHNASTSIPSWLLPIGINIIVIAVSAGVTWGLMKGDVTNQDLRINAINATLTAQIVRIDAMLKDWDRITRLEERLGNVVGLLHEIRADLRDGRYTVRRDGAITSTTPGANRNPQ